jgi:hypothetical protein
MAHKTAIANGHTNNSIGIWTNGSVKNCKIMGLGTGMVFSWGIGTIENIDLEVCNTGILIGYAPIKATSKPYYRLARARRMWARSKTLEWRAASNVSAVSS